jgi:hypothetical protein
MELFLELPGPIRLDFFIKSLLIINGIYSGAPQLNSLTFLYYVCRVLKPMSKALEASRPATHQQPEPVAKSMSKALGAS